MSRNYSLLNYFFSCFIFLMLTSCATEPDGLVDNSSGLPMYQGQAPYSNSFNEDKYATLLPQSVNSGEKMILVDPNAYAWGAYDATGRLVKAGIASAGGDYCPDEGAPCKTQAGSFRIFSLGDASCISHTYPIGNPGSLMPYCMFFNKGQSLHGAPDQMMSERNESHGCVRMRIPDAEWIRYNFASIGTKVVVLPYQN